MITKPIALSALFLGTNVAAWNADIHQQIGFLAEYILETAPSPVLPIISHFLEPEYNGSIGRAGAWADEYKDTKEGKISYQWHWISALDKAPDYCNVYYWRDCGKAGCVVRAIEEQTAILSECVRNVKERESVVLQGAEDGTREVNATCSHALKWVVHFLGDVTQPLHASGRAFGGNAENVTFGGERIRLHEAWDRSIIYLDANVTSFPNDTIQPFFQKLADRMRHDDFDAPIRSWLSCDNPVYAPEARECAMAFARESNQLLCSYVYGRKGWDTDDIKTSGYAQDAFPIVELQVSKAAVRLAQWLFRVVYPGDFPWTEQLLQHFRDGHREELVMQEL